MEQKTIEILADYGLVAVLIPALGLFVLRLIEEIRKLVRERRGEPVGNGLLPTCKYPGVQHFEPVVREIRSIYEDGIRRAVRDEQLASILEKVADNIQQQTETQRIQREVLIEIKNDYRSLIQQRHGG
jgi:hypothetical protein